MTRTTQENILTAARRLFAAKGFDACTVDEIAREAGVNKASIYYHHRDKQGLYQVVLELTLTAFLYRVRQSLAQAGDAQDRLAAFIRAFAGNFQEHQGMGPLMLRELAADGSGLNQASQIALGALIGELDDILTALSPEPAGRPATLVVYIMIVGTLNIYSSTPGLRRHFPQADPRFGFSLDQGAAAGEVFRLVLAAFTRPSTNP